MSAGAMPGGPPTDDERLCVELELEARELSKHYNAKAHRRAALIGKAAKRIRELSTC